VQDFTADSSSPSDTPLAHRLSPDLEKDVSARSPSFHANLENRWFDGSQHDERRSTPSPSPTEPTDLKTYVEMNTPQRFSPKKQNAAPARSPAADVLPAGSPGKPLQNRAQLAWGVDEVRPLTPTAGDGNREGTPVPFGWEGNDNAAISLVDADLSLSPIEMHSTSFQAVDPSFAASISKLEQSDHSQSVETPHDFVPISIRSAVPEMAAAPAYAPPSPPRVVSLGALKRTV
jgi:hypothetical protein